MAVEHSGPDFQFPRFTVSPFRLPPPRVRASKGGEGPSFARPLSRTACMRLRQKHVSPCSNMFTANCINMNLPSVSVHRSWIDLGSGWLVRSLRASQADHPAGTVGQVRGQRTYAENAGGCRGISSARRLGGGGIYRSIIQNRGEWEYQVADPHKILSLADCSLRGL